MDIPGDKKIVLFDGVCNLCNSSVQFILKRDKRNVFLFGSLQGNPGQQLLKKYNQQAGQLNSFILIENNKIFNRSTAVLRVLRELGRGWQVFYGLIILPKFIRDGIYNIISKHRYKWFGKTEECSLPLPQGKEKFLD